MATPRDAPEGGRLAPDISIDVARRRVIYTPEAVPTVASIAAIKQQLSQESILGREFAVVFDLRELRTLDLTTAEMHQVIWEWPIAPDGPRALVVSLPVWYSLLSPLGTRLHILYSSCARSLPRCKCSGGWRPRIAGSTRTRGPARRAGVAPRSAPDPLKFAPGGTIVGRADPWGYPPDAVVRWMTRRDRRRAELPQQLCERVAGDDVWVTLTRAVPVTPGGNA